MKKSKLDKYKEIIFSLNEKGFGLPYLTKKFNVDSITIKRLFKINNVKFINHEKERLDILEKEKQKIIKINQNGFCISKIGKIYNVDPLTINKKFKEWKIPYLKQNDFLERKHKPFKKEIIKLYKKGYSEYHIAKELNLKPDAIIGRLNNWDIKLRTKIYKNNYLKTNDGNLVRSQAELIISNFLYEKKIKYEYEKKVGPFKCDFYLSKYNLYIEYWGSLYRSKTYHKKLRYYKNHSLNLYSIYPFEKISIALERLINNITNRKFINSKPTLWYFPLERLPERYTTQLHNWLTNKFFDYNINYITVEDEENKNQRINTGQVLDTTGTIKYKCGQLVSFLDRFIKEFREGDKLFFSDIWYPGIEGIVYSLIQAGYTLEIYGLLHSGTFDEYDFTKRAGLDHWMRFFEKQIIHISKKIFIGSEYMKNITIKGLNLNEENAKKLVVTGMPFNYKEVQSMVSSYKKEKEHYVVFPNRFNIEKGPDDMMKIMDEVMEKDNKVKLILTTSHKKLSCEYPYLEEMLNELKKKYKGRVLIKKNLSKKEYYEILAKSKISLFTSKQETFGYCLAESVSLGCIPICINKLSYVDVLGKQELLYNNKKEAVEKILYYLKNNKEMSKLSSHYKKYMNNIELMLKHMNLII